MSLQKVLEQQTLLSLVLSFAADEPSVVVAERAEILALSVVCKFARRVLQRRARDHVMAQVALQLEWEDWRVAFD